MKSLRDLFLNQLADIGDAERRCVNFLPRLATAATVEELKRVIEHRLTLSKGHVVRIECIFDAFDEKPRCMTCEASVGLFRDVQQILDDFEGSPVIDAALMSVMEKMDHFAISTYGCLQEWAIVLGNKTASDLLQGVLAEEKSSMEALVRMAMKSCDPTSAAESGGSLWRVRECELRIPERRAGPSAAATERDALVSTKWCNPLQGESP